MSENHALPEEPQPSKISLSALSSALLILGCGSLLAGLGYLFSDAKLIAMILLGAGLFGLGFGLGPRFGPAWSAIGGAGLVLAGIGLLLVGLGTFEKTPASIHWPTAPATIIRSDAESYTTTEKVGKDENIISYQVAIIEYNYSVGDTNYASSQIALAPQQRGDAARLLTKYPIYKQFRAYYNPDNPGEAVLEPGKRKGNFLQPLIGVLLMVVGSLAAIRKFQRYLETLS
ncbi:DUF3592 domain-containing protein [bacterium]|nr:DUF3592 domain-containing protein [bacterium]